MQTVATPPSMPVPDSAEYKLLQRLSQTYNDPALQGLTLRKMEELEKAYKTGFAPGPGDHVKQTELPSSAGSESDEDELDEELQLMKKRDLSAMQYFERGYESYVDLISKRTNLPEDKVRFSVARSLNLDGVQHTFGCVMGWDLELDHLMYHHPKASQKSLEKIVEKQCTSAPGKGFRISLEDLRTRVKQVRPKKLELTASEFKSRLKSVPLGLLSTHSQRTWRAKNAALAPGKVTVNYLNVANRVKVGDAISDALGFNLGLLLLQSKAPE